MIKLKANVAFAFKRGMEVGAQDAALNVFSTSSTVRRQAHQFSCNRLQREEKAFIAGHELGAQYIEHWATYGRDLLAVAIKQGDVLPIAFVYRYRAESGYYVDIQ